MVWRWNNYFTSPSLNNLITDVYFIVLAYGSNGRNVGADPSNLVAIFGPHIDILPMMRNFYGSANSILCHSKYVSELTKLSLFESFALPVLMYGLLMFFSWAQLKWGS